MLVRSVSLSIPNKWPSHQQHWRNHIKCHFNPERTRALPICCCWGTGSRLQLILGIKKRNALWPRPMFACKSLASLKTRRAAAEEIRWTRHLGTSLDCYVSGLTARHATLSISLMFQWTSDAWLLTSFEDARHESYSKAKPKHLHRPLALGCCKGHEPHN